MFSPRPQDFSNYHSIAVFFPSRIDYCEFGLWDAGERNLHEALPVGLLLSEGLIDLSIPGDVVPILPIGMTEIPWRASPEAVLAR